MSEKRAAPSTAGRRRFRVAVLNTHPIQYFAPLYRLITERYPQIDLTVIYLTDYSLRGEQDAGFAQAVVWDIDLLGGYKYKFVGKNYKKNIPRGFFSLMAPAVWTEIRNGNYDLLWTHGYSHLANFLAIIAAKISGAQVALRGDSQLLLYKPGFRRLLRNGLFGFFFRGLDVFMAIGTRNRDYYRYLGVPAEKIIDVPYAIDNARFAEASPRARSDSRVVVLFAAKLVDRKDPMSFVEAARILQDRAVDAELRMAGSGPLEAELRQYVAVHGLLNVTFLGFVNQSEMPTVLADADVLVATSDWEPWGLVVNEAMAAGLAIIASPEMGCAPDLVEHGVNGYLVPTRCPDKLADAIERYVDSPGAKNRFRDHSLVKIENFSLEACAAGFVSGIPIPD